MSSDGRRPTPAYRGHDERDRRKKKTKRKQWRDRALFHWCPTCLAEPGTRCIRLNSGGKNKTTPHQARSDLIPKHPTPGNRGTEIQRKKKQQRKPGQLQVSYCCPICSGDHPRHQHPCQGCGAVNVGGEPWVIYAWDGDEGAHVFCVDCDPHPETA